MMTNGLDCAETQMHICKTGSSFSQVLNTSVTIEISSESLYFFHQLSFCHMLLKPAIRHINVGPLRTREGFVIAINHIHKMWIILEVDVVLSISEHNSHQCVVRRVGFSREIGIELG